MQKRSQTQKRLGRGPEATKGPEARIRKGKGCEAQKKLGLGRGPEAHKRPRRDSRTLEEAQKPTKGLEEATKPLF